MIKNIQALILINNNALFKWNKCPEFLKLKNSGYFVSLIDFLKEERLKYNVFPKYNFYILNSFKVSFVNNIDVLIIGKHPYLSNESNGYAYSSNSEYAKAMSLYSIRNAVEDSRKKINFNFDFSLSKWRDQNVFIMNRAFTISKEREMEHINKWNLFSSTVLKILIKYNKNLIINTWGDDQFNFVKNNLKSVNNRSFSIVRSGDPGNSIFNKEDWHNDCFNKINKKLTNLNKKKIEW